jgi:DNA ligase 1
MSQQTLDDGEEAQVKGSSSTYTLSRKGHIYACTCPAWRNQGAVIDRRTCKHLRAYLGDAAETARVGAAAQQPVKAVKAVAGAAGNVEGEAQDGAVEEKAPPILLAHKWEVEHDPTGWWMSEKLDGVRAYWDGDAFVSRLGNRFLAPDWFTEDLPADTLDGELWVGRKLFSRTISIVRSGSGGELWKDVRYVVFDAPNARGGFEERLAHVDKVLKKASAQYARVLDHVVCTGFDHLHAELARVEALGGEGLMLREPRSSYSVGRSTSLLKVKTFHDAEGRVVAHVPGAGKHKGRLGAVVCELPDGTTFNIGTGFSDAERKAPPPIGAVVTFRYQELTDDGIPRFPSWVGVRIDAEWPPRSEARPVSQGDSSKGKSAIKAAVRAEAAAAAAAAAPAAPAAAAPAAAAAAAPAAPAAASAPAATSILASLVHPDGKFWEIELKGNSHITRFGKVGTPGQNRIAELGDAAEARADADKRAAQKRKEGYAAKK